MLVCMCVCVLVCMCVCVYVRVHICMCMHGVILCAVSIMLSTHHVHVVFTECCGCICVYNISLGCAYVEAE